MTYASSFFKDLGKKHFGTKVSMPMHLLGREGYTVFVLALLPCQWAFICLVDFVLYFKLVYGNAKPT